ncbi:hypothetical protein EGR_04292 [Echinococcus granulosus]|uniref:Uncharacterized protein n=1 Tax=Echinococcus granulosus TaxID=6210 RepID=W6UIF8_ECHGR|nr:hypothetical protein EGR_04292 [Echinococcus granulosus]EUB60853.1 hypothetical protein EGR_04292 [Echinococcus granulosus]
MNGLIVNELQKRNLGARQNWHLTNLKTALRDDDNLTDCKVLLDQRYLNLKRMEILESLVNILPLINQYSIMQVRMKKAVSVNATLWCFLVDKTCFADTRICQEVINVNELQITLILFYTFSQLNEVQPQTQRRYRKRSALGNRINISTPPFHCEEPIFYALCHVKTSFDRMNEFSK